MLENEGTLSSETSTALGKALADAQSRLTELSLTLESSQTQARGLSLSLVQAEQSLQASEQSAQASDRAATEAITAANLSEADAVRSRGRWRIGALIASAFAASGWGAFVILLLF
jgi:hypothetical protein